MGSHDPAAAPSERILPELACQVDHAQLQALHEAALWILDVVGLEVDSEELVSLLAPHPGVRVEGGRLHLSPWLVEGHAAAYRRRREAETVSRAAVGQRKPWEITLSIGSGPHFFLDLDSDELRPITLDDFVTALKLADSLADEGVLGGQISAVVLEVPPPLMALVEYRLTCEHSRSGHGFVNPCPIAGLEYLYEMHQVMGHTFHLPLYVVSPLRLVGDSLEAILRFRGRPGLSYTSSSMPLMGINTPIHLHGAFAQTLAEGLGGYVVLQLIAPGVPATFGVMAQACDMRYGTLVYGSPEQNLCDLLGIWINTFYGQRIGTRLRTMAKCPGLQAGVEKASSGTFGALAGSRHFAGAGTLALDIFSPEQLVADVEIRNHVSRQLRGFRLDGETLALDVIAEAARRGEYLSHESTLAHFRSEFWSPTLFQRSTTKTWQTQPEGETRELARVRARAKLASHRFELAPEKSLELERIYRHAVRRLA